MTKVTVISLELAAQCWCDEDTSNIEMDSHLANAFAKRLDTKDKRIAELEKELDNLNSGTDDLYNMVFEHVGLKLEFPDEVDHTDIKQLLKAHNLEVRKQAFTDAVRYMEHSDKLITTHDVEIFIAEVDVYLKDKAGKS
jgi:hypothetical protein